MKKNNFSMLALLSALSFSLIGCGNSKLAPVDGFKYEDGILSFNEVKGASGYQVSFKHKEEIVYEDIITDTAIDIDALDLGGSINLSVKAVSGKKESEESYFDFTVMRTFDEVIIEAEDNLYNFGTGKEQSNFRNNSLAHKGAYVGGLDDAGHGIYINYLSPEEGSFKLQSYYCFQVTSSQTVAHQDVYVNGSKQARFNYTEQTGWGGSTFNPAMAEVSISLKKGWNTISIMKNGDSSDNWGDYAEIDYVKIIGSGNEYNPDDLDVYGERPAYYRLEAEMGSPRKKQESGLYMCKNPCISDNGSGLYSNGFLMGGVEAKYDGVEWHFDSPVKAKYSISIAYASGQFDGSSKARPTFIVTQKQVLLNKNVDFNDYTQLQMDELDYTGWNNPTVANQTIELSLEKGDNFIYCLKMDGSGFFQIDYCDLTFISEVI